jgi:membrane protease YdiL (CAAX protease family)
VLWTFPLLVLGLLLSHGQGRPTPGAIGFIAAQGADPITQLPWQARLTLSIGAGLYEELLFRLILIAAAHFVLADIMRLKSGTAGAIAAIISATAFALYHDVVPASGGVDWRLFFFYTLAGLYFASVFVLRGFGIAVGVHALYDVLVLVVEPFLRSGRTALHPGGVLSDALVQVLFGPGS